MLYYRNAGIFGTGWVKTASLREEWGNPFLIDPD